jgi:endonuclease-8
MPEGDTVFKLAGYLRPQLGGRRLVAGKVRGMPETTLAGRCIDDVYARGKHLFIEFDQSWLLRSHLGMRGSWHAYAAGEPWQKPPRQASIVLDIGERLFVCFNALEVEFLRNTGVRRRAFDAALGPDLLGDRLDIETILRRARELGDPDMPVADVLLSQRIASGIGNVYKSEVLFLEACHPATPLARMADAQLAALYRQASRLLRRNRHGGPRVTRWVNDAAGRLWVYGRTGQHCLRCDDLIRSAKLGSRQRSTFWCPRCQSGPGPMTQASPAAWQASRL